MGILNRVVEGLTEEVVSKEVTAGSKITSVMDMNNLFRDWAGICWSVIYKRAVFQGCHLRRCVQEGSLIGSGYGLLILFNKLYGF